MIIKSFTVGMVETNCYLLIDEQSGEAAVIDPGEVTEELETALKAPEIKNLKYILLTHGHFDHILGVCRIKEITDAQIAIHKNDAVCLEDERYSLAGQVFRGRQKPCSKDIELNDGDVIKLGNLEIKVIFTPGHTKGGCCFAVENVIFSGDTLFAGSVGRCDLPGGNFETLMASLGKLDGIFENEDYRVLPGHGEETKLDAERRYNPYLRH